MNSMMVMAVSQFQSILKLLATIIVFILVLAVTYGTTRWIGNYQKTQFSGKNIEYIEGFRISNNKYIQIFRIGKEYVALAVCKDTVTVLTKMSEDELDLCNDDAKSGHSPSFAMILSKIKEIKPEHKEDRHEDSEDIK